MTRRSFWLTPLDTLFFRDSRPFEAGSMQAGAASLFPPPGRTLVGAVRLALARGRGFDGRGRWSKELAAVLGDGPNNLGMLRFYGPVLGLRGEPLYPLPLHVLGERVGGGQRDMSGFRPETLLAPGEEVLCDLRRACLPAPVRSGTSLHSGAGFFVRKDGLEAVLAGHLPEQSAVVSPGALYVREGRVGLQRDGQLRTASDGQLYSSTHLRLRQDASLVLEAEGVPEGWAQDCPRLVPLGGESRMAELEVAGALSSVAAPAAAIAASRRLTVTLLTPLRLRPETMPGPGQGLLGLPGVRVVSACLGKPVLLGGWDSLRSEPLPLRPYVPAGSTWFCTIDDEEHASAVCARHGCCLDDEAAFGLGCIALGTWNEISSS